MKTPSFRTQLTLISVLLSGTVLVIFGSVAWTLIYRERMRSVDQELALNGQQVLGRFRTPQEVRLLGSGFSSAMDRMVREDQVLWMETPRGEPLWISEAWPSEISRAILLPNGEPMPIPDDNPDPDPLPPRGGRLGDPMDGRPGGAGLGPPLPGPGPGRRLRGFLREQAIGGLSRLWSEPDLFTLYTAEGYWRIGQFESPQLRLFLGVNLDRMNRDLRGVRASFLIALPFALLLIAAGGLLISRQALGPVKTLTHAAERITARGLDERINEGSTVPEFRRLIRVFNEMLDRLETSFGQAIRFSADASHELKTPLAVMQGEIEQAMHAAEGDPDRQRILNNLLEQAQRLKDITRKLLLLSQADSGRLPLSIQEIDLTEELEQLVEDAGVMAESANLDFRARIAAGCMVRVDPNMLRMAIMNLLSNAMKFNHPGGYVECTLILDPTRARLRIANSGPTIPQNLQESVFERFHRGNARQSATAEGSGLGLGLAREIARAHGGDVLLVQSEAEETTFDLTLPRSA